MRIIYECEHHTHWPPKTAKVELAARNMYP